MMGRWIFAVADWLGSSPSRRGKLNSRPLVVVFAQGLFPERAAIGKGVVAGVVVRFGGLGCGFSCGWWRQTVTIAS